VLLAVEVIRMTWQIFLSAWLFLQCVVGAASIPGRYRELGKTDMQAAGAVAGTILKFTGIFACLYFGGYYS